MQSEFFTDISTVAWTDSQIVLDWNKSTPDLGKPLWLIACLSSKLNFLLQFGNTYPQRIILQIWPRVAPFLPNQLIEASGGIVFFGWP